MVSSDPGCQPGAFPPRCGFSLSGTLPRLGRCARKSGAIRSTGQDIDMTDAGGATIASHLSMRPDGRCRRPDAALGEYRAEIRKPDLKALEMAVRFAVYLHSRSGAGEPTLCRVAVELGSPLLRYAEGGRGESQSVSVQDRRDRRGMPVVRELLPCRHRVQGLAWPSSSELRDVGDLIPIRSVQR